MKQLYILILAFLLCQYRSMAQADSFMYITFDHTLFTGNTIITGGVVPHFSDAGIEAITNKYTFKEFGEACSSCRAPYWKDVYKAVVNNTYAGDELKAAYPTVFDRIEKYGPVVTLGVPQINAGTENILYPNPADRVLFIDHSAAMHLTSISVTDATGRAVKITQGKSDRIEIAQLPGGMYLFRLSFDDRAAVTEKVVIHN